MDRIFERGDYRAFLVVAVRNHMDDALFALPVLEGETVSSVLDLYLRTYVPKSAKVKRTINGPDDASKLGYVLAHISVGGDQFVVSTIIPSHMIWSQVVSKWEDQWVFDHLAFIGEQIPNNSHRELHGSTYIQSQVAEEAERTFNRYMLMTLTLYAAFVFTRDS